MILIPDHSDGCDCQLCNAEHRRITGHAVWCDMIHDGNRQCSCAPAIVVSDTTEDPEMDRYRESERRFNAGGGNDGPL